MATTIKVAIGSDPMTITSEVARAVEAILPKLITRVVKSPQVRVDVHSYADPTARDIEIELSSEPAMEATRMGDLLNRVRVSLDEIFIDGIPFRLHARMKALASA